MKRFTLILIPEDNSQVIRRYFKLPSKRASIAIAGGFLVFLIALGFFLGYIGGGKAELIQLRSEKDVLTEHLTRYEEKIKVLDNQIQNNRQFEEKMRLFADLPEFGQEVWEIGVGGYENQPDTTLEFLSEADYERAINVDESLDKLLRQSKFQKTQFNEIYKAIVERNDIWNRMPSVQPVSNWTGISEFGWRRHPIYHYVRKHNGLDFICRHGTPINATGNGTVVYAGWKTGFGYTVDVDHGNSLISRYAHCSLLKVKEGDTVVRGQIIARVGATGLATGSHCHYEIRKDGIAIDPSQFVLPDEIPD